MRRRYRILSFIALMLLGCAPSVDDVEQVAEQCAPIYVGTGNKPGKVTTNDRTGPSASVGSLIKVSASGFPSNCSATAISRTTIITARHCYCDVVESGSVFTLPQPFLDASGKCQNGFAAFVIDPPMKHPPAFDKCLKTSPDEQPEGAIADIELLTLSAEIPMEALPELPRIDLGPDVFATAATYDQYTFVQVGFGGTSWESDSGFGTRREGIIEAETLTWGKDYKFPNRLEGYFLEADADCYTCSDKQSTHSSGDSGGGFFLQPLDATHAPMGRPILIGVSSGIINNVFSQSQTWASTSSRHIFGGPKVLATSNAALILRALESDADRDAILDRANNCAPNDVCPQAHARVR